MQLLVSSSIKKKNTPTLHHLLQDNIALLRKRQKKKNFDVSYITHGLFLDLLKHCERITFPVIMFLDRIFLKLKENSLPNI